MLTARVRRIASEFRVRLRLVFLLDWLVIFSVFYAFMFVFREMVDTVFGVFPLLEPGFWRFAAVFLASFYLTFRLHRKYSWNIISLIEDVYPLLRERLSTAYDNQNLKNIIVEDLISKVDGNLKGVSGSRLLKKNLVISKLLTAFFLLMLVFYVVEEGTSVTPDDVSKALAGIPVVGESVNQSLGANESDDGNAAGANLEGEGEGSEGSDQGGNILGKPTIASIEGKKIDIVLYSGGGIGTQLRDASETQDDFTDSPRYPVEERASNVSDSYIGLLQKSELEKELINRYAIEQSKRGVS